MCVCVCVCARVCVYARTRGGGNPMNRPTLTTSHTRVHPY